MKVMHILPDIGVGGAEKFVIDLVESKVFQKMNIIIVSLYPNTSTIFSNYCKSNEINIVYLNKTIGFDLRTVRNLRKLIKTAKPDVIHTHRYVLPYTILAMLFNKKIKVVHTIHNQAEKELSKNGIKLQRLIYFFKRIETVAISDKISDSFKILYKRKASAIIYNGINTKKYWSSQSKKYDLIHVGRFSEQKNHILLLEIIEQLKIKSAELSVAFVGDGELLAEIMLIAKSKGITQNIEFLGIRKDIPALLADSKIFVLSSKWEGNPLVILEAISSGIPVVTTDVGGIPDVVTHKLNGYLYSIDNSLAAVRYIENLLNNSDEYEKISKNNISRKKLLDISICAENYLDLYTGNNHE